MKNSLCMDIHNNSDNNMKFMVLSSRHSHCEGSQISMFYYAD